MNTMKVSEIFYSIQGEGRYMGVPSIFLRTFGCNFTCGGFGMPRGQMSDERNQVDAKSFKDYRELPLVTTGCDSYASWDTRFKHLSPKMPIDQIVDKIVSLLPHKEWHDEHLVITGGEPLLGWQKAYPALLDHEKMHGLTEITFETNGTQEITPQLKDYLSDWNKVGCEITFSVSAKLPCSGEKWDDAIKPEIVTSYEETGYTYLKFVVANEDDVQDALRARDEYVKAGFSGPTYLMPVGGVESVYALNNKQVALLAIEHGLRYSDRLQVPLFKNAHGT